MSIYLRLLEMILSMTEKMVEKMIYLLSRHNRITKNYKLSTGI